MNTTAAVPSKDHVRTTIRDEDAALVARVRIGDHAAYAALVDRHGDRLYAMLLHLADGDRDLAAEWTQEAFARAYINLHQFAGTSAFYTWLYRLARNRAFDLSSRKRPQARDLAELGHAAPGPTPIEALAADDLRAQVHAALARIPTDARELILLRDFDGLDYAALAAVLDVPEGTVKSRLSRARGLLRSALAGHVSAEDLA